MRVNDIAASVSGNTFLATGVPLAQGRTVVTAVATSATGRSATTSINLFRDSVPPRVTLYYPTDGAVVTQSPVVITGMVDDIVVGTINAGQVTVTVNGTPAVVLNRAFTATGISLTPGLNTIVISAVDQGQNTTTLTSRVTYESTSTANRLTIVSGDAQAAAIGAALPAPAVVRLTDATGTPLGGAVVRFQIIENNGTLTAGSSAGRNVSTITDANGQASVLWTLGTRSGSGNQRVAVTAAGATASTELIATGTTGPPALIVVDSGSNQYGGVGAELSRPIVAVVVDRGSNRLSNVPVTFSVVRGGGNFAGQPSITVTTDSDGRAITRAILGPDAGNDNNVFTATAPMATGAATFLASGLVPGNPADTRISGVVLDNSNVPIAGVSVRIDGTALVTQTDAQGLFELTSVPVGYVKLFVDGSTAQRPGTWPTLEYAMYTVPGQNNTLGMPIYLLPIDVAHGLFVDETHGGTLTLAELPGFSLTVAAGTATFPGGGRTGTVSVTLVHADKMPMPPGFGQQPRFLVTIQPPGVHFDPPAPMTLPNVDGLTPGEITEMYSFDHDLGQFVAIGTGSVSEDGSVIRSDPGVGIIKGGWHCASNPAASGTSANCGECAACTGTQCVADPAKQGLPCTGNGNPCTEDICNGTECKHTVVAVIINSDVDPNQYASRDDPTSTTFDEINLPAGQPVYGNSNNHVGDIVRYAAYVNLASFRSKIHDYKWKAIGPSPDAFVITGPQGPNSSSWTIFNLDWKPGIYQIRVDVTFTTGCIAFTTYTQRVGIRTDDVFTVGAILAEPFPPEDGVDQSVINWWSCSALDTTGVPTGAAGLLLATLSLGQFTFNAPPPPAVNPAWVPLTVPDRIFMNYFIVDATRDTFPSPNLDLNAPANEFYHLQPATNFRAFARAQFKYLVEEGKVIPGTILPVANAHEYRTPLIAAAGQTPAPCGFSIFSLTGEVAPENGHYQATPDGSTIVFMVKMRAPHPDQDGFRDLNGRELPWVFFRYRFGATDGHLHSNATESSSDPDASLLGRDTNDYSPVPSIFVYRKFLDIDGTYRSELLIQTRQDLMKFLRIAKVVSSPVFP